MCHAIGTSGASSHTDATERIPKNNPAPLPSATPNFSAAHLPGAKYGLSSGSQNALEQPKSDKRKISAGSSAPSHPPSNLELHNIYAGPGMVLLEIDCNSSHDAAELSEYLSRRLAKRYLYKSGEGNPEVSTLRKAMVQYMPYLNLPDLRQSMTPEDMWPLLRLLNAAFFVGMVRLTSTNQFKWLETTDNRVLAMCGADHKSPIIYLHPWRIDYSKHQAEGWHPTFPMRDRLSSILHELCHALFISNCAPSSSSWHCGVGVGGHGPAWRRIAHTIEEVSGPILGFQLDLGRDVNRVYDTPCSSIGYVRLEAYMPSSGLIFNHQSLDISWEQRHLPLPSSSTSVRYV